ncbi:MAG: hypothetical protein NUV76_12130 [Candidatus Kuenenia sp.]|nr:hypothetical protein [Candidatus Kuenenia sp.]
MTETLIEYGQDVKKEALNLSGQAKSLKIITKEDFAFAGEIAISLARVKKQINSNWKPMSDKAKASLQEIKDNWNKELSPIEEAENYISAGRRDYKVEQDRIERAKQEQLEKEAREKAEKERQALLDKAAEMEKLNPKKAEILLEKAEAVIEKPVFVKKAVEKTTKMESGGSITWIKDIEVTVISARTVCQAIANGIIPITCVEFKNLKQWVKMYGNDVEGYGLEVKQTQRESKRV